MEQLRREEERRHAEREQVGKHLTRGITGVIREAWPLADQLTDATLEVHQPSL